MASDIDLERAFERALDSQLAEGARDDQAGAHASDLGQCLYKVYLRRSGAPAMPRNLRTKMMLTKGLADEAWIVNALEKELAKDGWQTVRNEELPATSPLIGHLDALLVRGKCPYCNGYMRRERDGTWICQFSANADEIEPVFLEYRYLEIKTTSWKEKWETLGAISEKTGKPVKTKVAPRPYEELPRHQRLQALAYALNLLPGVSIPYAIFQLDRNLHGIKQYPEAGEWYDPEDSDWLLEYHHSANLVIDCTNPDSDPLASGIAYRNDKDVIVGMPPEKWWCDYCEFSQCGKNKYHNDLPEEVLPF